MLLCSALQQNTSIVGHRVTPQGLGDSPWPPALTHACVGGSALKNTPRVRGDILYFCGFHCCAWKSLQDFRNEIKDEACRAQVHKQMQLASQDIRFNAPLADACYIDRTQLCPNVPPVSI